MSEKPYGWEVVAEFCDRMIYIPGSDQNLTKTYAYRNCTQAAAIRRVKLKKHFRGVVEVQPLSEEQFIRAYGKGRV